MIGLTPCQRELMVYLQTREQSPTFREIMAALDIPSTSQIFGRMKALEERGYIRRRYNRSGVEILRRLPVQINGQPFVFIPKTRAA